MHAAWLLGLCAACTWNQTNGTTFSDPSITSKPLSFQGYYPADSMQIQVQVIKDADDPNPSDDTHWGTVATGTSGTQPVYFNDPNPLYNWSASGAPTSYYPKSWTAGGLLHVRVRAALSNGSYQDMRVFDDDFGSCYVAHQNESWSVIGDVCGSPYGDRNVMHLVSTAKKPSDAMAHRAQSPYLAFGQVQPGSPAESTAYYLKIGAFLNYPTLAQFKTFYGFGTGNPDEVSAIYFNAGDLGLGREMHCTSFPTLFGKGRACFVTNYAQRDADGDVIFDGDPTVALNDAISHKKPVATVAMVYEPNSAIPNQDLGNAVKFLVYFNNGDPNPNNAFLSATAPLDRSDHPNQNVPNNCLTCHGATASFSNGVVTNARFLPFDLDSFKFSSQAPFALGDQQDEFRKLNATVAATQMTQPMTDLLKGWYPPNGPATSNTFFHGDFIPPGWVGAAPGSDKLYTEVIKPYCRTCHISQQTVGLGRDFSSFANANAVKPAIQQTVCVDNVMPQAMVTQDKFWTSSARAHLVAGLGLNTACKPQTK